MDLVSGFDHLTAWAGGAREYANFFTGVVSQRMVKRTVLFDGANPVYHLYYANEAETPGTVSATLPYEQIGWKRRKGPGQVKRMVYSALLGSLGFWVKRLERHGVECGGGSSGGMGADATLHVYPGMDHGASDNKIAAAGKKTSQGVTRIKEAGSWTR